MGIAVQLVERKGNITRCVPQNTRGQTNNLFGLPEGAAEVCSDFRASEAHTIMNGVIITVNRVCWSYSNWHALRMQVFTG